MLHPRAACCAEFLVSYCPGSVGSRRSSISSCGRKYSKPLNRFCLCYLWAPRLNRRLANLHSRKVIYVGVAVCSVQALAERIEISEQVLSRAEQHRAIERSRRPKRRGRPLVIRASRFEERYRGVDDYLQRIQFGDGLIRRSYLLAEDLDAILERVEKH
jgi:hypothetical protein